MSTLLSPHTTSSHPSSNPDSTMTSRAYDIDQSLFIICALTLEICYVAVAVTVWLYHPTTKLRRFLHACGLFSSSCMCILSIDPYGVRHIYPVGVCWLFLSMSLSSIMSASTSYIYLLYKTHMHHVQLPFPTHLKRTLYIIMMIYFCLGLIPGIAQLVVGDEKAYGIFLFAVGCGGILYLILLNFHTIRLRTDLTLHLITTSSNSQHETHETQMQIRAVIHKMNITQITGSVVLILSVIVTFISASRSLFANISMIAQPHHYVIYENPSSWILFMGIAIILSITWVPIRSPCGKQEESPKEAFSCRDVRDEIELVQTPGTPSWDHVTPRGTERGDTIGSFQRNPLAGTSFAHDVYKMATDTSPSPPHHRINLHLNANPPHQHRSHPDIPPHLHLQSSHVPHPQIQPITLHPHMMDTGSVMTETSSSIQPHTTTTNIHHTHDSLIRQDSNLSGISHESPVIPQPIPLQPTRSHRGITIDTDALPISAISRFSIDLGIQPVFGRR